MNQAINKQIDTLKTNRKMSTDYNNVKDNKVRLFGKKVGKMITVKNSKGDIGLIALTTDVEKTLKGIEDSSKLRLDTLKLEKKHESSSTRKAKIQSIIKELESQIVTEITHDKKGYYTQDIITIKDLLNKGVENDN